MSALADEHVYLLNVAARNAGMLSQPAKRGWPELRHVPRNLELEREFFADAVTSDVVPSEGDCIRGVWSGE